MGCNMLQEVRQDLADVVQVCEGKKKQTNDLRTLISELVKGKILLFLLHAFCQCWKITAHLKSSLSVFTRMSLNRLYFEGITGIHLFFFLPRHPPSQLVSLHSSSLHDCDPVGGRLQ